MFVYVLAISFSLCVAGMLVFHGYLILSNQTTLEFYDNKREEMRSKIRGIVYINQYDKGRKRNFEEVFGVGQSYLLLLLYYVYSSHLRWLLPSFTVSIKDREDDDDLIASSLVAEYI